MREQTIRHDPSARGPIPVLTIQQAAAVIDESHLVELVELWEKQDSTHPGGRPPYLNIRATLILWLALAAEHQPMHIRRIEDILRRRLTPKSAALLGIRHDPLAPADAHYERARVATRRILNLFDAYWLPTRHRRLTVAEYEQALAYRRKNQDTLESKARRAHIFLNDLLEATYKMLPAEYQPAQLTIGVDATRLRVHARGISKTRLRRKLPHERISVEPDHGFYVRGWKGQPVDDDHPAKIREYALEAEFAVMTSNDPAVPDAVPFLIVAYDQHRPGNEPAASARRLVESLEERGHIIDHFVTDQAYIPGGKPEDLQDHLRERGIKLVMNYPGKEYALGIQAQAHGAIMVEGNWYCPSMAQHADLINATEEYRRGNKADDEDSNLSDNNKRERQLARKARWKTLINQRAPFLLRPHDSTDARGKTPMKCPAAGESPTVSCDLKPNPRATRADRVLLPILNRPQAPGKLCTNKLSVTFDLHDEGKYGQYYQYGSDEWERYFGYVRSQSESANNYVKDDSTFALYAPGRRRMRGPTAQAFLQVMTIAAANLQRIRDFLLERDERAGEIEDGIAPPAARSRRSRRSSAKTRMQLRDRRNRGRRNDPLQT
jgi:hypothetical protein